MNIGEFKHRITLMKETEVKNENGFKEKSKVEVKKVWARIREDKRTRIVMNEKEILNNTLFFDIRYLSMDFKDLSISYQGKTYAINGVSDKDFGKKMLSLVCEEVV